MGIEGRKAALEAIAALKEYMPGCSAGKLRNFGMTIGIRDTYKIDSVYNLSDEDVKNECRFEDSVGIYPGVHRRFWSSSASHHW